MIDRILLYTNNKYNRGLSSYSNTISLIASSIAILNVKTFYSDSAQRVNTDIKEMTVKQAIYNSIVNMVIKLLSNLLCCVVP